MKRPIAITTLLLALAGCATAPPHNPLAQWVPSPNYNVRRPILIVLHATEEGSVQASLNTLRTRNADGPVSAHYLIGEDGVIYQLVPDTARAWHAGVGRWGTITDVNAVSLGIELANDGQAPYPAAQIDSLLRLLTDLTTRWRIPASQIIGHEDLAPTRKRDPGVQFPWQRLADAGFGAWPRLPLIDPPASFDAWTALGLIGYPLDDRAAAVLAFRRHFRGMDGDVLDAQDLRVLYALTRQISGQEPATP